ncbi:probable galacturonosyltransferase 6 isoform X2 [Magnolia sinica]|uniref:probable galacturonosyltransferase 6 isoform X2 n=1 Tax=Magnolia sinica TaxID=86752 RepID=UPI002659C5AE|nr:probable galacturonosyltransferase 6 isoform X2 [Magnolia sinica]
MQNPINIWVLIRKAVWKWQRILILLLLFITVFAQILVFPKNITTFTSLRAHKEFLEDISSFKHTGDGLKLNAIHQELGEGLKEPTRIVYKDENYTTVVRGNSSGDNFITKDAGKTEEGDSLLEGNGSGIDNASGRKSQPKTELVPFGRKGQPKQLSEGGEPNRRTLSRSVTDEKVRQMKDQLIMAKAYLNFALENRNSHLVRDLKQRIKEVERAVGAATKDSDLSRRALQRMRSMEVTLSKASRVYPDCFAMAIKLRAMTHNAEEQVRAQKNQASHLVQLAARTFPKGLHCLSMRLTADYYSLQPVEREFPNRQNLQQPDLYHYAVFSDNVLACAVVINSTVSTSAEPEKIVFHVVTDALNLPAMSMWFLANSPGQATIQVVSMDNFKWLPSSYNSMFTQPNSLDPRYTSKLNHLRFYLPDVFPTLKKVVLLDHDVVVQKDLKGFWSADLKGKVNGAVETCGENESFHRMDMFINFSDASVAKRFDAKACTWAFGMNVFDLREWRRRDLTAKYHRWLQLGKRKQLWKAGSLPLGLLTFYNHTVALDRRWHVLGLGYESGVGRGEIERAAVIHYNGNMKPWLEIGMGKYRSYWSKFLNYDHPYLQQCNIHE